jgi:hypothetical protein
VPADKIVLGMPLYGRAFTNTTGSGQPFQGVGEGSWESGVWDYKDLPRPGAQEHYDKESGATYSYDNNSKTMISYDTLDMAKRKVQYIKEKRLGGAMWWELSGDKQDNGSIVKNVRILGPAFPPLPPLEASFLACSAVSAQVCLAFRPTERFAADPLPRNTSRLDERQKLTRCAGCNGFGRFGAQAELDTLPRLAV